MNLALPLDGFSNWLHEKNPANLLADLQTLDSRRLGLYRVARGSGLFDDNSLAFSLLQADETATLYSYRIGLFYREMDTTCPCSGDEQNYIAGYCEILLQLDLQHSSASLTLLDD